MNFRRQPFQFSTIDPAKRQAELQKRFGLPAKDSDMFVDYLNPGSMGSAIKEPSLSGSPRLQHRVPIFTGSADKGSPDQNNVDGGHKPRVRVVPIQVEGVDGGKRQRTFSGPAGMVDVRNGINRGKLQETFPRLDSKVDESPKRPSQSRVCTIPIQIEPRDEKPKVVPSSQTPDPARKVTVETNGCAASIDKKEEHDEEPDTIVPLKQIEAVLNKLEGYKEEVEKFSGSSKDKQYRYLDEMLTRCMLDLDNVDTMGLNEIRKARKEAVRQVQQYVDLLDTKVNECLKKVDSDTPSVNSPVLDGQMSCDVPIEANDSTIPDSSDMNIECASGDAEMSDIATENGNDTKNFNESSDMDAANVVEMSEDSTPEVMDEKMEVSTQDDLMESEGPMYGKENTYSIHDTEVESTSCSFPDSVIKECENKSGVVIEELDVCLLNNVCTSEIGNETVSCIISDSPGLDVKETIIEEGNSEIVIEEIDDSDTCETLDGKDLDHSINACDSSANSDKNFIIEQSNNQGNSCDVTGTKLSSDDCIPVLQENIIVSEKQ